MSDIRATVAGMGQVSEDISQRSYAPLTFEHLGRLADLAAADRSRFYQSHPEFAGRHLSTVLAQGAALHWVDGVNGVKDLDVWSFFRLPVGYGRFPADRRRRVVDFGPSDLGRRWYDLDSARDQRQRQRFERLSTFRGRPVDLMLRGLPSSTDADPIDAIRAWLQRGSRKSAGSAWYLSQKAVILIEPVARRGEVIWSP